MESIFMGKKNLGIQQELVAISSLGEENQPHIVPYKQECSQQPGEVLIPFYQH